jgi:hypothetical protein
MKVRGYYLRKQRDNTTTDTTYVGTPTVNKNIISGSASTSQSVSIVLVFSKQQDK